MRILIIEPSWIGDAIMSHTMHRLLIQQHYKIKIDVIASNWNQALFYRMPEIHKVLPFIHSKHGSFPLKKYYQYGKLLQKNNKYQQAIILPNSFKSGLIPFFANIPKRTGWRGEMRYGIINDIRTLNNKNFPLMIQRYAALAFKKQDIKNADDLPQPLPLPYLQCTQQETITVLNKFNIIINNNKKQKRIGICPGAEFGQSKRWPTYHYSKLISKLIYQGYQIILLGSYKEITIGITINNDIPQYFQKHCYNLIGLTSLDEAILLLKTCDAIVSNDSGLMHISCALQRPIIGLFGPTNPNCTPPLYKNAKIIKSDDFHYTDKKKITKILHHPHNKYHPSLINIEPEIVLKTLYTIL